MTDIWVCSNCHSLNRLRATKCYKCGTRQTEAMDGIGNRRVVQALQSRAHVPYRSSWFRALLAGVLVVSLAAWSTFALLQTLGDAAYAREVLSDLAAFGTIDEAELERRIAGEDRIALVSLGLAIATVVAFGAWLSRVVMNVPVLGGGTPDTTPTRAFVYPLVPILNLIKVPGIVQDVLYRLTPTGGGFFLVAAAWVGIVGSAIFSAIVNVWIELRFATGLRDIETIPEFVSFFSRVVDIILVTDIVTTVMTAVGAVVLVLVMIRIEFRAWARDREIRHAVGV